MSLEGSAREVMLGEMSKKGDNDLVRTSEDTWVGGGAGTDINPGSDTSVFCGPVSVTSV